jgi:hypothetical protein
MRYEIDPVTFGITVFDANEVPFLVQPDYPNYDKFDSIDEATTWALAFIEAQKPESLYYAPTAKNVAARLKPTQAEIDAMMAKRFETDGD